MLTKEAFNALLKTLEEPPEHAYFILATTEIQKVPTTIISRCQRFDFRRMSLELIVSRLKSIADLEGFDVEDGSLEMIASRVSGGMRDAIGILDQISSEGRVHKEDLRKTLGLSDQQLVLELADCWLDGQTEKCLSLINGAHEKGVDFENLLHDLLVNLRRKMLKAIDNPVEISKIIKIIDAVREARKNIDYGMPQLSIEMAVIRTQSKYQVVAKPTVAKKVITEKKVEPVISKPIVEAQNEEIVEKVEELKNEEVNNAEEPVAVVETNIQPVDVDLDHLCENWKELLKGVKNPAVRISLQTGKPSKIEGNTLTLSFDSAFHKGKVDKKENQNMLEEVLKKSLGQTFKVIGEVIAKTDKEKKAVADEALEIFGGEIAD